MHGDMHTAAPYGGLVPPLRVLIASEVRFLRESLGDILGRDGTTVVVGLACDCDEILGACQASLPDMLLLDAALRDGTGAVRQLRAILPGLRAVIFAVSESVESVLLWAEAGAAGYIPREAALADVQALLADIRAGRQACSASVSAGLLRRIATSPGPRPQADLALPALTPREREIVGLLGTGLSNKEIARRLNIGVATTKSHVHSVLAKLNVQRRGQAAHFVHARSPGS